MRTQVVGCEAAFTGIEGAAQNKLPGYDVMGVYSDQTDPMNFLAELIFCIMCSFWCNKPRRF